jgi:hypothetical protein
MIDIKKLSNNDLAYIEGFIKTCADKGVDPEPMLAKLAGEEPPAEDKPASKAKSTVKRVAGGAGKGALAGGAIGAGLGAVGGAVAKAGINSRLKQAPGMRAYARSHKGEVLAGYLKAMLQGGTGGALLGAAGGAVTGGAVRAVS